MPSVAIILKGVFARLLYISHGLLCAWRLTEVKDELLYWVVVAPIGLLPIEMVITMLAKKTKGEWKWFCPSIFLYLCTVVSSIYLLEVELMNQRIDYKKTNGLDSCKIDSGDVHMNTSGLSVQGISVPISLTDDYWVLALEQFLFCIVIVGRWFLPKGDMSREQLSTLLLVYIGMASDMLEFVLEGLKEPEVKCNVTLVYLILSIWAVSMTQFAMVLTAKSAKETKKSAKQGCCKMNTEIRGILITSLMQDAPFLVVRLLLLIRYRVVNQMMIFFTCKNSVMLLLQGYRLIVILADDPTQQSSVAPAGDGDVEGVEKDKKLPLEEIDIEQESAKFRSPRV